MAEPVTERIILAGAIRGARTIVAPFQVQILQGDQLVIAYVGASALNTGQGVQISFRSLAPNGEVTSSRYIVPVTADYVVHRHTITMAEGFLLSMAAHPLFTALQGQFWVQASISRTSGQEDLYLMPLLQGYPSISQVISWPGSPLMAQSDGQWYPRELPAPVNTGQNWSLAVPTGAQWQVTAAHMILTTSATVADRSLVFFFTNAGAITKFRTLRGPTQTASQGRIYSFGRGAPHAAAFSGDVWVDGLPNDLILAGGDLVQANVLNLQVGDSWSQAGFQVLERLSFV